jgi:hypothetical protein
MLELDSWKIRAPLRDRDVSWMGKMPRWGTWGACAACDVILGIGCCIHLYALWATLMVKLGLLFPRQSLSEPDCLRILQLLSPQPVPVALFDILAGYKDSNGRIASKLQYLMKPRP